MGKAEECGEGVVTGAGTCWPQPCSWACLRGSRACVDGVPTLPSVPSGAAEGCAAPLAAGEFQRLQGGPCRAEKHTPVGQVSASKYRRPLQCHRSEVHVSFGKSAVPGCCRELLIESTAGSSGKTAQRIQVLSWSLRPRQLALRTQSGTDSTVLHWL